VAVVIGSRLEMKESSRVRNNGCDNDRDS
jgi:hypothetical protein